MWPSLCYCRRKTQFEFHEFPPMGENRVARQWQWLISYCQDISSWAVDACTPTTTSWWDKDLLTGSTFSVKYLSKLVPPPRFQWVVHCKRNLAAWSPIFTLPHASRFTVLSFSGLPQDYLSPCFWDLLPDEISFKTSATTMISVGPPI